MCKEVKCIDSQDSDTYSTTFRQFLDWNESHTSTPVAVLETRYIMAGICLSRRRRESRTEEGEMSFTLFCHLQWRSPAARVSKGIKVVL